MAATAEAAAASVTAAPLDTPFLRNASALLPFRARLADQSRPCNIVALGDSITEGAKATTWEQRWANRLVAALRASHQPAGVTGGRGYVPSHYLGGTIPDPWTRGGTTTQQASKGLALKNYYIGNGTNQGTATITFEGTGIDVLVTRYSGGPNNGLTNVAVDGGTAVNVNGANATEQNGYVGASIRGLTPGTHTAVITSTSILNFEGVMIYNGDETKGIRIWEGGRSGSTTSMYGGGSTAWQGPVANADAALVTICFGLNDFNTGVAVATFKSQYQQIITRVKASAPNASILLIAPYLRGDTTNPTNPWTAYLTALDEIVDADSSLAMLDLNARMKGYNLVPTALQTMWNVDKVHPSDQGHQLIADTVSRFVRA